MTQSQLLFMLSITYEEMPQEVLCTVFYQPKNIKRSRFGHYGQNENHSDNNSKFHTHPFLCNNYNVMSLMQL